MEVAVVVEDDVFESVTFTESVPERHGRVYAVVDVELVIAPRDVPTRVKVYGLIPPLAVKVVVDPNAGAEVVGVNASAALTVIVAVPVLLFESVTVIVAVPAATPVTVTVVLETLAVAVDVLELATVKGAVPFAMVSETVPEGTMVLLDGDNVGLVVVVVVVVVAAVVLRVDSFSSQPLTHNIVVTVAKARSHIAIKHLLIFVRLVSSPFYADLDEIQRKTPLSQGLEGFQLKIRMLLLRSSRTVFREEPLLICNRGLRTVSQKGVGVTSKVSIATGIKTRLNSCFRTGRAQLGDPF